MGAWEGMQKAGVKSIEASVTAVGGKYEQASAFSFAALAEPESSAALRL